MRNTFWRAVWQAEVLFETEGCAMRILGVVVLVLLGWTFLAISPFAAPSAFIDYPSAMLVLGGMLGILLLSYDADVWKLFLHFLLQQSRAFSQDDRETLDAFLQTAGRGSLACGGLGTLIGLIIVLGSVADPGMIRPGMAVALLTILYALLLSELVIRPMRRRLAPRHGGFEGTVRNSSVPSG